MRQIDPSGTSSLNSFLVLGGSSAIGAAAIQLIRDTLPSATILTTSSAQHHERLKSLGATKCFERSAQGDVSAIRKATPGGLGVEAILDTVGAAAGQPSVFDAFRPDGSKKYSQVITGANIQVPEGVNGVEVFGRAVLGTKNGWRTMSVLGEMVQNGTYKTPTSVETVGKGLESISPALDRLQKGTSGLKYVVAL